MTTFVDTVTADADARVLLAHLLANPGASTLAVIRHQTKLPEARIRAGAKALGTHVKLMRHAGRETLAAADRTLEAYEKSKEPLRRDVNASDNSFHVLRREIMAALRNVDTVTIKQLLERFPSSHFRAITAAVYQNAADTKMMQEFGLESIAVYRRGRQTMVAVTRVEEEQETDV